MSFGVQHEVASLRYSQLCLEVIYQDRYSTFSLNGDFIWLGLISQLSSTNLAVSTALATFGAVYEAVFFRRTHSSLSLASVQYSKALSALQEDVASQYHGPIPSFLASVLLAASQVLQRRYNNSLTHLKGAFTVLTKTMSRRVQNNRSKCDASPSRNSSRGTSSCEARLSDFAQSLDLLTASFVLHRPPELPSSFDFEVSNQNSSKTHLESGSHPLQSLLHHCYHIANAASPYKYLARYSFPTELAMEQGRCIAHLSQWLTRCNDALQSRASDSMQLNVRQTYLLLQVQCLSTLIYLSVISSPYESTYDTYTTYFQQIIQNAEEIITSPSSSSPSMPVCRFRVQPGLAQALFITSTKYRNSTQRRKAIDLLSKVGMEGPWDPDIMCKVARRAVEIEESRSLSSMMLKQSQCGPGLFRDLDCSSCVDIDIPEQCRLHGCGVDPGEGSLETNNPASVHFSLCKNVENMVRSQNHESTEHWIIWTEPMVVGAGPFS
ncbi:uncharacterized protein A1O9_01739 [Exophiala aquamarina CBS 119918]|uniref:Transcription factor domain-containing protein n=1 Tax=Exophiala aquamarina CBS 119918 TaxID=1182545 RepID=A0A072PVA6_9EURO|nr:uncharacterized protein A1O9_01739 [Exophiala aquamarina CBS 119918]KEF63761.1 hypothetical protein A1O9_01739 [Exophiala aquamarina CBS 119918]